MKKAVILLSALFIVSLFSIPVFGQSAMMDFGEEAIFQAEPGIRPSYGTSSNISYVVSMYDCGVHSPNQTWEAVPGFPNRYLSGPGAFMCPVHVPNGALIVGIELEACDSSASGEATLILVFAPGPGGGGTQIDAVSTGVSYSGGCGYFEKSLGTPVTIDNFNNKYFLQIMQSVYNSIINIAAARVYYRLQVSPAPATATFGDVPTTHPFFQYIEALVHSGITAGCGGGSYCPDAPVTRGQMAVFLSRALGLHWPY